MDSLIYLRENDAAALFNISRQSVHNWLLRGVLRKQKIGRNTYFVAKLGFDENQNIIVECFPEPQPKPMRKVLSNVKTKR